VSGGSAATDALSAAVVSGSLAVATSTTAVNGFDPGTGGVLWSVPRARGPLIVPALDPVGGQSGVLVYTEGGRAHSGVVALDPATRKRLWRVAFHQRILGAPAIADGMVFVGGEDRFVYALDEATGAVRWKARSSGIVDTAPAVDAGGVFVQVEDPATSRGSVWAFDASSGKVRWRFSAPAAGLGGSAVTAVDGRVYAGFGDFTVRCLDQSDGRVVWQESIPTHSSGVANAFSSLAAPAVSGGAVFLADENGDLYRFDARTGTRMWDYQFPSFQIHSPIVVDRWVLMGSLDGTIGAVDRDSGLLAWSSRWRAGGIGPITPIKGRIIVPVQGKSGPTLFLATDPSMALTAVTSPSNLDLPVAVLHYALAFVIVLVLVLGLFRVIELWSGRRAEPAAPYAGGDDVDEGRA
jgi:outer membrane protein assembly factor BamB